MQNHLCSCKRSARTDSLSQLCEVRTLQTSDEVGVTTNTEMGQEQVLGEYE